jgi:hypothetical protein
MQWTGGFKIVSFYSPEQESAACGFAQSVRRKMPHVKLELELTTGQRKSSFIASKLEKSEEGGVLWIEPTAIVERHLSMPDVDFAIFARFADRFRLGHSPFRTRVAYFGKTEAGQALADRWDVLAENDHEQWALHRAWLDLQKRGRCMPSTYWLSKDYSRGPNEGGPAKVVHLQAGLG